MATQAQYDAATKAITDLANQMISSLPWFEEGPAQQFVTGDLLSKFAKVAVDAALAVPESNPNAS